MKLILASSSPRRAELLRQAGFAFEVYPAHLDETRFPVETAKDYVQRLAEAKARVAAQYATSVRQSAIIVAADTTVVAAGEILEKPRDAADARRMLRLLGGKTHEVYTGLSVLKIPHGIEVHHVETTRVTLLDISASDIDAYIATGEPFDKAGAYGIQGEAGKFVTRIEGCYFNVMGLPLSRLWAILKTLDEPNATGPEPSAG